MHSNTITINDPFASYKHPGVIHVDVHANGDYSGMAYITWVSRCRPSGGDLSAKALQIVPLVECVQKDCEWIDTEEFLTSRESVQCPHCFDQGRSSAVTVGDLKRFTAAIPGELFKIVGRSALVSEMISKLEQEFV